MYELLKAQRNQTGSGFTYPLPALQCHECCKDLLTEVLVNLLEMEDFHWVINNDSLLDLFVLCECAFNIQIQCSLIKLNCDLFNRDFD